ncbi:dihydrofolate reductase family protein [Vibrio sp. WXL103]|uniref:dihydrofolate reductase family protein n=1 Tax=Vibrio sp. WXL103 TaxID=3450710 RepID=UPI003EC8F3F1
MKCSVFIATSVDGFIARKDGSVDWLHSAGNPNAENDGLAEQTFGDYIASIDCMIMGRNCMQVISDMDLTPEQWPYGETRIIVLSTTLSQPPENMQDKVELYSGELNALLTLLESEGYQHAYVDGGATIQSFLNLKRIDEMTITYAPIILGEGIRLFGPTNHDIKLTEAKSTTFANDFIQVNYKVSYPE